MKTEKKDKKVILDKIKNIDAGKNKRWTDRKTRADYERTCIEHYICPDCGEELIKRKVKLPWYWKLLYFDCDQWKYVIKCSSCNAEFEEYFGDYYYYVILDTNDTTHATYRITYDDKGNIVRTQSYWWGSSYPD